MKNLEIKIQSLMRDLAVNGMHLRRMIRGNNVI